MRTISDTIGRLQMFRQLQPGPGLGSSRLVDFSGFGSNPGNLKAKIFAPAMRAQHPVPLVVVLHGCTQTAAAYDAGTGWTEMAGRAGFVVLFAEQDRSNNPNLCFNWFLPGDTARGSGEALSIVQMIAAAKSRFVVDPAQIFITGLSAGAAMAGSLLCLYPELFAGGGLVAGLPFGAARSVPEAFDRMRGHGLPDASTLAERARHASGGNGPWPRVLILHGDSDTTVLPANANATMSQWRELHGLVHDNGIWIAAPHGKLARWTDRAGQTMIEYHSVAGLGHGTPISPAQDGLGRAGAFILDSAVSSTSLMCGFWGLSSHDARAASREGTARPGRQPVPPQPSRPPETVGVKAIIENALRRAGLM